jgi:hypothetical protein
MRNTLLTTFMLVAFFPTSSSDKRSCSNEPMKSATLKVMAQPLKKVNMAYDPFEIVGTPLGNGLYSFALDITGTAFLYIQIATYGVCPGIQNAYGSVTNFIGVTTYDVINDPYPANNYIEVDYSYCTSNCGSICCQWTYDTFTGYLYKKGTNQDGSPKFVISYTTLTTSGCPED